jgi:hypothetical protein
MTAITKLLAQKEQLTEQLQKVSAPEEREQIEGLLAKINTALHLLVDAGPGLTD